MKVVAVIVAAGSGSRMEGVNKQFYLLDGRPVLSHTLQVFAQCGRISEIVLVCREAEQKEMGALAKEYVSAKSCQVVAGSTTRQKSVFLGIRAAEDGDYYVIHDGARPFVTSEEIENCLDLAVEFGGAAVGVMVKDTIKKIDKQGRIVESPDRAQLVAIHTPQIFRGELYRSAMEKAIDEGKEYTDDCQLIENNGGIVQVSLGSYENIKITTREDLALAKAILDYRQEGLV